MPLYKDLKYLRQSQGTAFDETHPPGAAGPCRGIYRCEGCGYEVICEADEFLPGTPNCIAHESGKWPSAPKEVRWRLVTSAIR